MRNLHQLKLISRAAFRIQALYNIPHRALFACDRAFVILSLLCACLNLSHSALLYFRWLLSLACFISLVLVRFHITPCSAITLWRCVCVFVCAMCAVAGCLDEVLLEEATSCPRVSFLLFCAVADPSTDAAADPLATKLPKLCLH